MTRANRRHGLPRVGASLFASLVWLGGTTPDIAPSAEEILSFLHPSLPCSAPTMASYIRLVNDLVLEDDPKDRKSLQLPIPTPLTPS